MVLNTDCQVVYVDRFHRIDWELQVRRVKAATDRYHRALLHIDSSGAGEPVFEDLRRSGVRCIGYPFTQRSKAALIDNLAILFEKRLVTIPQPSLWPEGIDELESYEYSITDAGNVKMEAPAGYHDDCVTALALAAWKFRTPKHAATDRKALKQAFATEDPPRSPFQSGFSGPEHWPGWVDLEDLEDLFAPVELRRKLSGSFA